MTPSSSNTWDFTINSSRGGIALVFTSDGWAHTDYILATSAEFARMYPQGSRPTCPPTKVVHASVAGIGQGETAIVSMSGESGVVGDGPFFFEAVYGGPPWPRHSGRGHH